MPVALGLPGSLSQRSYAPSLGVLYSCYPKCYHCKRSHYFSTTHDDKVNDCGFKFSVACEWCVLFKEDKDDSLQFTKVFPAKFLKLPIHQSFTPPPFCAIW